MELAGLVIGVVGVIPVLVEVVEGYRRIVEVAHVKRYMADLGQDLRTEKIILQNTYERLLDGIVPAWELGTLTQMEPQTSKWKSYDVHIRIRLRQSFEDFQKRTQDMQNAVSELQEKLHIDANGQVSLLKLSIHIRSKYWFEGTGPVDIPKYICMESLSPASM